MPYLLLRGNDHALRCSAEVLDASTGEMIFLTASATVEVTVLDQLTGDEITGQAWPAALSYIAGSQGMFLGLLSAAMDVTPGQALIGHLTADNGTNQHMERDIEILVVRARI